MTNIVEMHSLSDEALSALCGGNTSTLQQIINGLPLGPGIALPPTQGTTSGDPLGGPLGGLPLGPGPVILPPGLAGDVHALNG